MPISKWKKRILTGVAFVAILGAINYAADFALTPYDSMSQTIWRDYRKVNQIDMIYVGTSIGNRSYIPATIDRDTGLSSFNLSSNSEQLSDSYQAIQKAINEKHIKYVVLNLDYSSKFESVNSMVAYNQAMMEEDSITKKLVNMIAVCRKAGLHKKESIQVLFPWIFNHVSPNHIISNVKKKLNLPDNDDWHSNPLYYCGRGAFERYETVDIHTASDRGPKQVYNIKQSADIFNDKAYKELANICKVCKDNNVELLVAFSPKPFYSVLGLENGQFEFDNQMRSFLQSFDVPYYDFILLKPRIYINHDHYFYDFEHPNVIGSINYSLAFADFFNHWKAGDPVDDYFYTPEEYLQSIHFIDATYFESKVKGQRMELHGISLNGTGIIPEFEYQLWDDNSKEYRTIREYSENPDFTLVPPQKGKYRLRLNVRQAGSSVLQEQYFEKTVSF